MSARGVHPRAARGLLVRTWSQRVPVPVPIATSDHTCVVTIDHAVACWGETAREALGDGTTTTSSLPREGLEPRWTCSAVAAGDRFSCALTGSGAVSCWGNNEFGQLGDGTNTMLVDPRPRRRTRDRVSAIAARGEHACALVDSRVWCWGGNNDGQLGDGSRIARAVPGGSPRHRRGQRDDDRAGADHLRHPRRARGRVLGLECAGAARRRQHDRPSRAGAGQRFGQRRRRDLGGRPAHLCIDDAGRRQVLGLRRVRSAGQRLDGGQLGACRRVWSGRVASFSITAGGNLTCGL